MDIGDIIEFVFSIIVVVALFLTTFCFGAWATTEMTQIGEEHSEHEMLMKVQVQHIFTVAYEKDGIYDTINKSILLDGHGWAAIRTTPDLRTIKVDYRDNSTENNLHTSVVLQDVDRFEFLDYRQEEYATKKEKKKKQ